MSNQTELSSTEERLNFSTTFVSNVVLFLAVLFLAVLSTLALSVLSLVSETLNESIAEQHLVGMS